MRSSLSLTLATGFVGLLAVFPACGSSSNPTTDGGGGGSAGTGGTKGSGGKDSGTQDSGGFGSDAGVKGPCFYATLGDGKTCVSLDHWSNLLTNKFPKDQCTVIQGDRCGGASAVSSTHVFYFCCPNDCQSVGFCSTCTSQSAADNEVGMSCTPPAAPIVVGSPFDQCDGGGFSTAGAACCP